MGVTAHPMRYALADLALALSGADAQVSTVKETAVRAAADMVGDAAAIQLLGDDGRYDAITIFHAEPERARRLAAALDRRDRQPDDGFSTTMRATRRPIVLTRPSDDQLANLVVEPVPQDDPVGIGAAVLCPLIVDNAYLGYLLLVRTSPEGGYQPVDVDLARDIAGELALALSSARSMERLRTAEERYRRVLECIPEGVLQLDPEGRAVYANEPVGVMLGLPKAQLIGLTLHGFLDDRGQAELSRRFAECRAGRVTVGATRLIRADGSTRSVRMSMTPLPDEQGNPGGALCMITDTTDHIDARGLKRQLDHLRRLDSLGQLIGGISHDFNNLFTVIAGSAEIIAADATAGPAQQQLANEIMHASVTGRTLTHQLLAFGRPDGNRPETIAIPDLFADVQSLFGRILGEHIGLDLVFGPDVWPVRAERGPLEQALVNLAANARDAMLHGGVMRVTASNIEIEPGQLTDPAISGRMVHLELSDTGLGMDEETRHRACEPFFTTKTKAAGLGLATAASILRDFGGHLALESASRMGTTVHLYVPAADTPTAAAQPKTSSVGHVLVVEDQPELAQLVRRLVEPAGYSVTVATDAPSAVAQVAAGAQPDLLITDVVMPAMTGPELAAVLRTHRPELPVLFMSGYTAASLGPQIKLDSNSMLIEKPFTRSALLSAIRSLGGSPPPLPVSPPADGDTGAAV